MFIHNVSRLLGDGLGILLFFNMSGASPSGGAWTSPGWVRGRRDGRHGCLPRHPHSRTLHTAATAAGARSLPTPTRGSNYFSTPRLPPLCFSILNNFPTCHTTCSPVSHVAGGDAVWRKQLRLTLPRCHGVCHPPVARGQHPTCGHLPCATCPLFPDPCLLVLGARRSGQPASLPRETHVPNFGSGGSGDPGPLPGDVAWLDFSASLDHAVSAFLSFSS